MNTKNNKKRIKIILAMAFSLIAVIVIAKVFFNNKVNAGSTVPVCPICTTNDLMKYYGATASGHTYVCSQHGQYKTESHNYTNGKIIGTTASEHVIACTLCGYQGAQSHTWGSWKKNSESYHVRYCTVCLQSNSASHKWGSWKNNNSTTHIAYCSVCSEDKTAAHTTEVTNAGTTTHTVTCSDCKYTSTVDHTYGEYQSYNDESHIAYCTVCSQGNSLKPHKTTVTNAGTTTHTVSCSDCNYTSTVDHTYGEYQSYNDESHIAYCTVCSQGNSLKPHVMEGGKCTGCNYARTNVPVCPICTTNDNMRFIGNNDPDNLYYYNGDETHTYTCSIHGQTITNLCAVKSWEFSEELNNRHESNCTVCEKKYIQECYNYAEHVTGSENHICTICKQTVGYAEPDTEKWIYETIEGDEDVHQIYNPCKLCGDTSDKYNLENEAHSFEWKENGDGTHSKVCTKCDYQLSQNEKCSYEKGICAKCNGRHDDVPVCPICTTNDLMQYTGANTSGHTYVCSEHGQSRTEIHYGADHDNEGKCKLCNFQYDSHGRNEKETYYRIDNNSHQLVSPCLNSNCEFIYPVEDKEDHAQTTWYDKGNGIHASECICGGKTFSGNHTYTNGRCSVCNAIQPCDHTYEQKKDETHHWEECIKCKLVKEESKEEHLGATHENEGKCTTCDYQYEQHTKSDKVVEYGEKTETTHTVEYACSASECTETFSGVTEEHTGGTHENEGKCTTCDYQYEQHTKSDKVVEYGEKTETTHTVEYACSASECTETFSGVTEEHTGGTHGNEGKCTTCNYQYQNHRQTTIISGYLTDETTHTPKYACSISGCTTTYNGTVAEHAGGTHGNEGKCTTCNYQYQNHKLTTISRYITTNETHIPVYKCSVSECTVTQNGEQEEHEVIAWDDNENGTHSGECTNCKYKLTQEHNYQDGECNDCGATEPTVECEHIYVSKHNETYHWEECSKCNQIKTGTLQVHAYGEYNDNGDGTHVVNCTVCNYKIKESHNYENGKCSECNLTQPEVECNHTYVIRNNQTNHWQQCSKCSEVKSGSQEAHEYGNCADNGNGTHSSNCTICRYRKTEEHNYENGKCSECKAVKLEEGCEHSYLNKKDETYHWEECSKCNQIKAGTLKMHTFTNYANNENGTHTATCSKCGYKLTEVHPTDGECEDCIDSNGDGSNENGTTGNGSDVDGSDGNVDNTIVGIDIPNAGIRKIILIVIISLALISCLIALKVKRYKDI